MKISFILNQLEQMKNVLKKLFLARASVSKMAIKKDGSNSFSKYEYFTPEMVNKIVQTVNEEQWLFTAFNLKRNEFWVYWVLTVFDIDSWESMDFEMASEIPDIKATVGTQQLGWCVTYTERYILSTIYWIKDNSLDLDSDESYKARQKTVKKSEPKKEWNPNWRFQKAISNTKFMQECMSEEDFISKIKWKYEVDEIVEGQLREAYKNANWIDSDPVDLPFN